MILLIGKEIITMRRTGYEERRNFILLHRANNKGKKYRMKKRRGPDITHDRLLRAIVGSMGIVSRVAKKLDVCNQAVRDRLKQWEDCALAFRQEAEGIVDEAEATIAYLLRHRRDDHKSALGAAKLVLESKGKSRGWRREVTIQGGELPLLHGLVDVETLNLPLEARRNLLVELEKNAEEKKTIRVERIV